MLKRLFLSTSVILGAYGCQNETVSDSSSLKKPFWVASDLDLGDAPERFCARSEAVLNRIEGATNFVCEDRLAGALGARIDKGNYRIVLIQGVGRKWYLFAHMIDERASKQTHPDFSVIEKFIKREFESQK